MSADPRGPVLRFRTPCSLQEALVKDLQGVSFRTCSLLGSKIHRQWINWAVNELKLKRVRTGFCRTWEFNQSTSCLMWILNKVLSRGSLGWDFHQLIKVTSSNSRVQLPAGEKCNQRFINSRTSAEPDSDSTFSGFGPTASERIVPRLSRYFTDSVQDQKQKCNYSCEKWDHICVPKASFAEKWKEYMSRRIYRTILSAAHDGWPHLEQMNHTWDKMSSYERSSRGF